MRHEIRQLEILSRNGVSLLNHAVSDIHQFTSEHHMKLNAKKCKEMLINFMLNHNLIFLRPIVISNNTVERVNTYKLLGVIITDDLMWTHHIDSIHKKPSKRLYSLRLLNRVGVASDSILNVYLPTIRPILQYAVQVWQDIPEFLSRKLESSQKRALSTMFPSLSYENALSFSELSSLQTGESSFAGIIWPESQ